MQEYNICYSLDSEYTEQLAASIVSILKNSDEKENINFYILDGGLSKKDKTAIETLKKFKKFNIKYIQVNKKDFTSCPLLKEKGEEHKDYHVTLPTYFRFKIPEFFPDIDKILYLDCDVIVRSSLKSLFETNIDNMAAAMVPDAESDKEALRLGLKTYFNAGVILININYWRENNIEEKLFSYAVNNKDKILWQDQDILNAVLQDDIVSLDKIWNFQYFLYEKINPAFLSKCNILHLAGRFKPWLLPFEHIIYDIYYYYLSFTFRKNKIAEYRQKASGKYLKNNIGGSVTNILLNATNEDIQGIYNEISKNYDFTKDQINILDTNTDNKINKIYDEISKNYEYTNEIRDSLTEDIKEHAVSLEQMFSQNFQNSISSTDSKITEVYNEITKNYDFTKESIEKSEESLKTLTDEKISKVYDEITKNYKYTEYLVLESEEKSNQKIENIKNSANENISSAKNELYTYIDQTKKDIEAEKERQLNEINTVFNRKLSEQNEQIERSSNLKLKEIYSHTNNRTSKLYKDIKDWNIALENSFNQKVNSLWQYSENNTNEINIIKDKLNYKADENTLNNIQQNIRDLISGLDIQYQQNLNNLKNDFDEKINQQRIKYENKLINMENIISQLEKEIAESKKNIFVKFMDRYKSVKRDKK